MTTSKALQEEELLMMKNLQHLNNIKVWCLVFILQYNLFCGSASLCWAQGVVNRFESKAGHNETDQYHSPSWQEKTRVQFLPFSNTKRWPEWLLNTVTGAEILEMLTSVIAAANEGGKDESPGYQTPESRGLKVDYPDTDRPVLT